MSTAAFLGMSLVERLEFYGWDVTESGCWEFRGPICVDYGQMERNGRTYKAHRVSYEAYVGPIPDGLIVRHRCDNPPCVNPEHLEVGTKRDNAQDRAVRGRNRNQSGEKNSSAKLTEDNVREIRRALAMDNRPTYQEIGDRFGVTKASVWQIATGRAWASVT